jgi:hypothetical protein
MSPPLPDEDAKRIIHAFMEALGRRSLDQPHAAIAPGATQEEEPFIMHRSPCMRTLERTAEDDAPDPAIANADPQFISIFFANAPKSRDGLLLTEKKGW